MFISKINPRRLSYVDQLTSLALVGIHVPLLCKFRPDFIIQLGMHEWLLEEKESDEWYRYNRIGTDESFGLDKDRNFHHLVVQKDHFYIYCNIILERV